MIKNSLVLIFLLNTLGVLAQQEKTIADKISAVVGEEIILQSELENKLRQARRSDTIEAPSKCRILANSIKEKLLLTKAKEDSIEIRDRQVNNELNRRIQYFVGQIGSREKLEEYYEKSISSIKEEMREPVRNMLLTRQMRNKIVQDIDVSPKEVRDFFNNLPEDSIPYYNTQVKLGQIVRFPEPLAEEREKVKKRLKELRRRIVQEDEKFDNLAILYSDDQKTATKGGDLGMKNRNRFHDKIASTAINLDKGEVSNIIETEKGYHIIKLVERKGKNIHIKQILKKPDITPKARRQTKQFLDSIKRQILKDTLTFEEAAYEFSEDPQSRNNGGLITNPETGGTTIPVEQLNSEMFFNIDTMKVGRISKPIPMNHPEHEYAYRIINLKERIEPHKANLKQDYTKIRELAKDKKREEVLNDWFEDYSEDTYIRVNIDEKKCEQLQSFLDNTQSQSTRDWD